MGVDTMNQQFCVFATPTKLNRISATQKSKTLLSIKTCCGNKFLFLNARYSIITLENCFIETKTEKEM